MSEGPGEPILVSGQELKKSAAVSAFSTVATYVATNHRNTSRVQPLLPRRTLALHPGRQDRPAAERHPSVRGGRGAEHQVGAAKWRAMGGWPHSSQIPSGHGVGKDLLSATPY